MIIEDVQRTSFEYVMTNFFTSDFD